MAIESLVERAQSGDREALAQLVERHQTRVYSLALAISRNPTDAADLTQETFVRLIKSLSTFRGDGATFSTWLHRMTVNVCLDAMRRKSRTPFSIEAYDQDEPQREMSSEDRWTEPEWRAEWHESANEVRAALAELPLQQRVALTLHYFQDRSYEQIASVMDLPMNTVKSHLLRGKQRMARLLATTGVASKPSQRRPAAHHPRGNLRLSFVTA
jgi:RNA polymerase sigma-70 factor (ECF subfamily)